MPTHKRSYALSSLGCSVPLAEPLVSFVGESGPASERKDETSERTFAVNETGKSSIFCTYALHRHQPRAPVETH